MCVHLLDKISLSRDLEDVVAKVREDKVSVSILVAKDLLVKFYRSMFDLVTRCYVTRKLRGIFNCGDYVVLATRYADTYMDFESSLVFLHSVSNILKGYLRKVQQKSGAKVEIVEYVHQNLEEVYRILSDKLWKHVVTVGEYIYCCPECFAEIFKIILEHDAPKDWDDAIEKACQLIEAFKKVRERDKRLINFGYITFTRVLSAIYPLFYPPLDKEVYCRYSTDGEETCKNKIEHNDYEYIRSLYREILCVYRDTDKVNSLPGFSVKKGLITKLDWDFNKWYQMKPVVHHLLALIKSK